MHPIFLVILPAEEELQNAGEVPQRPHPLVSAPAAADNWEEEASAEAEAVPNRLLATEAAPPEGLCLARVGYDGFSAAAAPGGVEWAAEG